jgi:cytolysin (calcineurin-like family phosphatase)
MNRLLITLLLLLGPGALGARDLTFFHVSDTHYGKSESGDQALRALVEKMNGLPGTPYPTNLGGTVGRPRGVIHTGDITNDGKPEQWAAFVRDFGMDGTDGHLHWPVFESFGNHDGGPRSAVRSGIRARNRVRAGLDARSSNDLHVAWTWDGVQFIHCGISPGTRASPYDPEDSLLFLRDRLRQRTPGDGPVIVLQHFGFDSGHSLSWWKEETRATYRQALAPHPILAILHGHAHDPMIYRWEGYDIYHPPHFRQRPAGTGTVSQGCFVFHITDHELTVAERRLDGTWGLTARQPLSGPEERRP